MAENNQNKGHEENDYSNQRPITPLHQIELGIFDDSVYNTFLKSWNNDIKTPTQVKNSQNDTNENETDSNKLNPKTFVTPTKVFTYNNQPLSSSCDNSNPTTSSAMTNGLTDNKIDSVLSLHSMVNKEPNSQPNSDIDDINIEYFNQKISTVEPKILSSSNPKENFINVPINKTVPNNNFNGSSRRNSTSRFSLHSMHYNVSTSPKMMKSFSMNSISKYSSLSETNEPKDLVSSQFDNEENANKGGSSKSSLSVINPVLSNNSAVQNEKNNNMVSKNKNSIYKQFKKFNWRELTPVKTKFSSNLQTSIDGRSSSFSCENMLTTPLLNADRQNNKSSGSQAISFDNANIENAFDDDDDEEEYGDLNSPYDVDDNRFGENMISADIFSKRNWNPRSSFASSIDFSNNNNNNIEGSEGGLLNAVNLERKFSFSNPSQLGKEDYTQVNNNGCNTTTRGYNSNTYISSDENGGSTIGGQHFPLGTIPNAPPPLLLKQRFSAPTIPKKKMFKQRSSFISQKKYDIVLVIPYTNDNFDQCLGICNCLKNAQQYESKYNFNWKLTLTYVSSTQEELLIDDICFNLKIGKEDAKILLEVLQSSNKAESIEMINKKFPFLSTLSIDKTNNPKVKLLKLAKDNFLSEENRDSVDSNIGSEAGTIVTQSFQQQQQQYDQRDESILSNATTVVSVNEFKERDTPLEETRNLNQEISKQLTIPYLPVVEGKSYAPKSLIVFLYNYKHFNGNNSLTDYLHSMQKLFTEKEDLFLKLWKHALREIDNDSGIYHEYNVKHSLEGPNICKFTFYKPSNDLQIVMDEYFTAYNKEKFDAFSLNDCFINKESERDVSMESNSRRRSSFVETYNILSNIFKGEKKDIII
ncbi:hypothetical protein ACO0SA_001253 [Hanseniaspora valbyensis]